MPDQPVVPANEACPELGAELVRPEAANEDREHAAWLSRHAASCERCSRALQGARKLGRELEAWTPDSAPEDLTERTLARVRIAAALSGSDQEASAPGASGAPLVLAGGERGRSPRPVDLLATWALPGPKPAVAPPRSRLSFFSVQAAAAVLIFLLSGGFAITFYPAFVQALEDSKVSTCQARLVKVSAALRRYRKDHPDADAAELRGTALRDALVHGGYVVPQDLLCPAVREARQGMVSYELHVPDADCDPLSVLAWDRFGNHTMGFNIGYADGHTEYVETRDFSTWLARVRSGR